MSRYAGDPYWLTARFDSTCSGCQAAIKKGQRIFYYPNGKKALCDTANCGQKASAEFEAAKADEAMMSGGYC